VLAARAEGLAAQHHEEVSGGAGAVGGKRAARKIAAGALAVVPPGVFYVGLGDGTVPQSTQSERGGVCRGLPVGLLPTRGGRLGLNLVRVNEL